MGDQLLHHDVASGATRAARVTRVDANVKRQKRVFFLATPHVLVNDIVASPYMGSHPDVAAWHHAGFDMVRRGSPHSVLTQAVVTVTAVPFMLLNAAGVPHLMGSFVHALVAFVSK